MNKRKRKKNKYKKKENIMFVIKNEIAKELREDSIAHLIKDYFTRDNVRNLEMFKYDREKGKMLVSKKALNHILKICESELLEQEYDLELVDEIKVIRR